MVAATNEKKSRERKPKVKTSGPSEEAAAAATAGPKAEELLDQAQRDRLLETVLLSMPMSEHYPRVISDVLGLKAPGTIGAEHESAATWRTFLDKVATALATDSAARGSFIRRIAKHLADVDVEQRATFWARLATLWKYERRDDRDAQRCAVESEGLAALEVPSDEPAPRPAWAQRADIGRELFLWAAEVGARAEAHAQWFEQLRLRNPEDPLLEVMTAQATAAGDEIVTALDNAAHGFASLRSVFEDCYARDTSELSTKDVARELSAKDIARRASLLSTEYPFKSVRKGAKAEIVDRARQSLKAALVDAVERVTAMLKKPKPFEAELSRAINDDSLAELKLLFTEMDGVVRAARMAREIVRNKTVPKRMRVGAPPNKRGTSEFEVSELWQHERSRIREEFRKLAREARSDDGGVSLGDENGERPQTGPRKAAIMLVARLVYGTAGSFPTVRDAVRDARKATPG